MKIGVLIEKNDTRVVLTPEVVGKIIKKFNVECWVEKGAGKKSYFTDQEYSNAKAKLDNRKNILKKCNLFITHQILSDAEIKTMPKGSWYISSFAPYTNKNIVKKLSSFSHYFFSLDMLPRISRAQSMDVLSSMASIAGYQAVIEASSSLPQYFPMLITSAGTIKPAQVLVIGAGVAGLQAVATAKRLGAVVTAMDTRSAAEEEVKSLGGKFFKIEGAQDAVKHGYAAEQKEEFLQKQREITFKLVEKMNVIICTAVVRGRDAPKIITKQMVEQMPNGSVIVDLAASSGGNCVLTKNNSIIKHKNITIIGNSQLPQKKPMNASMLFANNVFQFLSILFQNKEINFEDDIIKETCIVNPSK